MTNIFPRSIFETKWGSFLNLMDKRIYPRVENSVMLSCVKKPIFSSKYIYFNSTTLRIASIIIIAQKFNKNMCTEFQFLFLIIKGLRSSALIFHEWNKNCFLFIFIISNRIQLKWKFFKGMKRGSFLQKSTLCLIIIWRKFDTVETNCIIFFITHSNWKYATGLENNFMVIHFQIQAESIVKRWI